MEPWNRPGLNYISVLHLLEAETRAFRGLEAAAGARTCPIVSLEKWTTSKKLDGAIDRIASHILDRTPQVILDIAEDIGQHLSGDDRHAVHDNLAALRDPSQQYKNWSNFIAGLDWAVPVLQHHDGISAADFAGQFGRLMAIGRGVVIRVPVQKAPDLIGHVQQVISNASANELNQTLIGIDLGHVSDTLVPAAIAAQIINRISRSARGSVNFLVVSTSFPENFTGGSAIIIDRVIRERLIYDEVRRGIPANARVIYGNYSSSRVRRRAKTGGGGPPRVDYATRSHWHWNRQDDGKSNRDGFEAAATIISKAPFFNGSALNYGTRTILEAVNGNMDRKASAAVWAGVRINLHISAQV